MKEQTIYEFYNHLNGFFVRGKNSDGSLRVMVISNLHGHWEEWRELTTNICGAEADERHAYIFSADYMYWRDFLEQNGLAKPTGSVHRLRGLFDCYYIPLYEFTDKFFDEAFVLAEED